MVNGKLKTWQVVRWLEKHPKHTASAPATAPSFDASTPDFAFVSTDRMGAPVIVGVARYRNDWTIVSERGIPVKFKQKQRAVKTGLVVHTGDVIEVIMRGGAGCCSDVAPISGEILIREKG